MSYGRNQGEEKLINNFKGEMSALYFIEASKMEKEALHQFLCKMKNSERFNYMVEDTENASSQYHNIITRIFLNINPRYNSQSIQYKQKVYKLTINGKDIDINNSIERLHYMTCINNNSSFRDVFINIEGINAILPCLYNIAVYKSTPEFSYV